MANGDLAEDYGQNSEFWWGPWTVGILQFSSSSLGKTKMKPIPREEREAQGCLFDTSGTKPSSHTLRPWLCQETLGTEPSTSPTHPGTPTELVVGTT